MRIAMFGVATCLSAVNFCLAQDIDPSNADKSARGVQLEEVIVTAQKTTETASKTPIALSVFSGDALQEQGVVNVADLQNVAPALNVGMSPAGVNISIRGVSSTDVTSKGDQGIVFNVDGIPVGRPREMGLAFFDLDRVEILRGPQGTLYGKSSTGGAINLITTKPQAAFDASASVEVGNFDARRGEAMVNVPVSENLAIRAAASVNARDGYLKPALNNSLSAGSARAVSDQNDESGRVSALWTINDAANLLVTGAFGHIGGTGANYNAVLNFMKNRDGEDARQVYFNPMGGSVDDRFQNFSTELNMDIGPLHLTYAGARKKFNAHDQESSTNDPAGNNGNYNWRNYTGEYITDSHELRLSNSVPQRLEWVAGFNYFEEAIEEHDQNWSTPVATPTVADTKAPNPIIIGDTGHKSTGFFGQANLHVTDDFKVTLGVRHSSDSMFRRATIAAGGDPCQAPFDCIGHIVDNGDQSADKVTWRVGADYQLTDKQMVYASVATGYKAGGFNDYDLVTRATSNYDPEELTAYEVGYKGQLLPNLQLNSSAFYYDYEKLQVTGASFFGFGASGPIIFIYTKSAPAVIYGWENELHFKVTEADMLDLSVALEKSYYKELTVGFLANNQIDWSDYRLDNTPKLAGTLSYAHRWFLSSGGYFEGRVGTRYSSGYFVSDLGGAANIGTGAYSVLPKQYKQESFTRSDASVGYTSESGKFDISFFVRNIEDDIQMTGTPQGINADVVNSAFVSVNAPRTFGVRFGVKY